MKTILVIEDDDNNMLLISRLLRVAGDEVVAAMTGEDGIRLAARGRYDAILLDICLPDLDGVEVLRRIRASGDTKTPIIAMTSKAMSGDRQSLMREGCRGYIEKPYDPQLVIGEIDRILAGDA